MDESTLPPPTHEPTDVSPRVIWIGVPALIITVVALALLVLWLFPGRTVDRTMHLPLPHYPRPELQPNPREDFRQFHAAKLQQLNSTGWLDRAHGIAHIPISDAMREVATEGISDWPPPPNPAPPSPATPKAAALPAAPTAAATSTPTAAASASTSSATAPLAPAAARPIAAPAPTASARVASAAAATALAPAGTRAAPASTTSVTTASAATAHPSQAATLATASTAMSGVRQ